MHRNQRSIITCRAYSRYLDIFPTCSLSLSQHLEWYKTTVSVDHFTEADWELAVTESTRPNSYLSLVHIFVMANVLQRPILLYVRRVRHSRTSTATN